jgi:hypothetical protein
MAAGSTFLSLRRISASWSFFCQSDPPNRSA